MPLRDAPLPRMAGHLPFMRGPCITFDDLRPGQVAAFGAGLGHGVEDAGLGPLGLRETSSYFGSHFTANMKSAMDVDERRPLRGDAVAGRLVDLGDIDFASASGAPEGCVAAAARAVAMRGALPVLLGGSIRLAEPVRRGLEDAMGRKVTLASPTSRPVEGPLLVILDLSMVGAVWHGGNLHAGFAGLSLSECRGRMRALGRLDVVGLAVTGLDPCRQGLSTVKTGQRLLVTAMLDLIYVRLDALAWEGAAHV